MSSIAMQGGATGSGTVTLLAPSTSTNRTLTLPDATGTVATAESTLSQFNASGSAPVYACRAWVNFNGTGTVAIRASGNVSSITDNSIANYTVNFTTAMPDVNYAVCFGSNTTPAGTSVKILSATDSSTAPTLMTTSAVQIGSSTGSDVNVCCVSIFR